MQAHLTGNEASVYRRFFFGDESTGTPRYTAYTIGYHIAQAYLQILLTARWLKLMHRQFPPDRGYRLFPRRRGP